MTQKTCSAWGALVLGLVAAARVASTYAVFSETNDEPVHVSAGLQIVQQHRYDYQPANPPLPRLFFAAGPAMLGAHVQPDIAKTLYSGGRYPATLIAARAGNLVFLALALAAAWAWARREAGDAAAFVAVLLLANEPLFLGHAGLATHDAAATAGVALSLLAFSRWRGAPGARNAALLGAAYGFAVLCKFSCIVFVPAACAAILLVRRGRPRARDLAVAAAGSAVVVCAGYAFFVGRFFEGLRSLYEIDRDGMLSYLHGQLRTNGFWDYFPIAVVLKTTLPLLALVALGLVTARRAPAFVAAIAAAAAMLLVTMKSTLDLGARYTLPLYVPLALAAAVTVTSARSRLARAAAGALVVAQIAVSALAHPDYVAYFNALAGTTPSRWLIDSNLEWGQDVKRLADTARALHVERLKIALMSIADLDVLGMPPREVISPGIETHGWIAVGEHYYRVSQASLGGRIWLDALPYRRVGKSIRLYHVR